EYDQFIVDPAVRMLSLRLLGRLELLQGRPVEAGRYYHQALTIAAEAETPIEVSHNLAELAAVAQSCGDSGKAARWMAFDACQIQRLERRLSSDEAALRLTTREAALAHLGPAEFASAWESGETLSTTDAVAEALAWHPEEKPLKPSTADLTRREQQVLDLLADHRTNKEIADCLFISERTVETHVANVLSKLGVQSRWDAVDVARSRDLLEN
ncbi:MAG: response regulator transcription factor, partial [Thermomicrobiales bacterium]